MIETFLQRFGKEPTVRVSAPGRINLIGEHVDYNGGSVLPIATPQRAYVQLASRSDDLVKAFSVEKGAGEYVLGQEQRGRGWL
ncbi:MAG TPA: galactokinase family protein, partial [Archangium sp.]